MSCTSNISAGIQRLRRLRRTSARGADAGAGNRIELNNGKVLLLGSRHGCPVPGARTTELLDPEVGAVEATGTMGLARTEFATALMDDGSLLVIGGRLDATALTSTTASVERYDPVTGTWSDAGTLARGRANPGVCPLPGGEILIVGGASDRPDTGRSAEVLSLETGLSRELAARMASPHPASVSVLKLDDGRCLVSGGSDGFDAEIFDPASERFTPVAPPPAASGNSGGYRISALPDGTILFVGKRSLVLDPATGAVRGVPE